MNRYKPDDEWQKDNTWALDGEMDLEPSVDGLEHISKSRIKTFLNCPREFAYTYWAENRFDGNYYTERGTQVHEVFERFYLDVASYVKAHGGAPEEYGPFMQAVPNWSQWLEFFGPFWKFEDARLDAAGDVDTWLPLGVEGEINLDDPPVGDLPWHGYYDALMDAASVPWVDADEGSVVIDFKTGSVKHKEAYRREGIYIDLCFYSWALEEAGVDVVAAIGVYPGDTEQNGMPGMVVREVPMEDSREIIRETVPKLSREPTVENYPIDEGPLCSYCDFYDQCPSTWDE